MERTKAIRDILPREGVGVNAAAVSPEDRSMPKGKDGHEDHPSLLVAPNAPSTNDVPCRGRVLTRAKLNWRGKRFLQKSILFDHQQRSL